MCAAALATPFAVQAQMPGEPFVSPIPAMTQNDLDTGQSLFRVHCARCHGMLGEGGEGPGLNRPRLNYATDDQALFGVINNGISGTGMPATWAPSDPEIWQIAAYVKSLGTLEAEELPGDPLKGQLVYENQGNCSACHIVNGKGRGVGPELGEVGLRRNRDYLMQSVTVPDADQPRVSTQMRGTINPFLTVRIVSEYGSYEGLRINEDEFSVQMRDLAGDIYSFEKASLFSYEKDFGHSLMPGYSAVLNEQDIDDLVAYLMNLKGKN
jgi:putative heme-binding domain-containing protein